MSSLIRRFSRIFASTFPSTDNREMPLWLSQTWAFPFCLCMWIMLVYVDYGCILEFLWDSLLPPHAVKQLCKFICHLLTSSFIDLCRYCVWTWCCTAFVVQWQLGIHQAGHCIPPVALSFIVDERLSTLSKCSAHLSKLASLYVRSVLFGPYIVFRMFWNFFMSFLSAKDWISSAFLLRQESCMSLSLLWTVLQMLL